MTSFQCSNCHRPYPEHTVPFRCLHCGGVFALNGGIFYSADLIEEAQPGLWKYRHTFGLPESAPVISLGEGDTPLVEAQGFGKKLAFKLEYLNPTGSFKDRGTAPLISFLLARRSRRCRRFLR